MSDLILEFYSEEIPSRMQKKASIDLKDIFTNGLDKLLKNLSLSEDIYSFSSKAITFPSAITGIIMRFFSKITS